MRRGTERSLWLAALLVPALLLGAAATEPDDGVDIYFRDVDLEALSDQDVPKYLETEPGESKLIERAFEGAPPQIPHTVQDMLPITADDNECLTCHDPENAVGKEDLPFPEDHQERPVMGNGGKDDAMVWVVERYETAGKLVGSRYSCTMCHAPQATNVKTPRSLFRGDDSGAEPKKE